jgi:hypothetical protein
MGGVTVASTCFRRSHWVGAGWFGDRSEAPPPVMSSLPAERSETEPSLGATESPGRSSLAMNRLPQGSGPARRLKDAVIAERRHDRVEVVAVEGISDPGRSRPTLAIDLLCRSTRAESQSNDPAVGKPGGDASSESLGFARWRTDLLAARGLLRPLGLGRRLLLGLGLRLRTLLPGHPGSFPMFLPGAP